MAGQRGTARLLLRPVIKLVIGVLGLLALYYIISLLPMLQEMEMRVAGLGIPEIVQAVIATVILVLIVNFGLEMSVAFPRAFPAFRESGTIANTLINLVAILVAYQAYRSLAEVLIPRNYYWIYSLVFFVIAVVPLIYLVYLSYSNMDKIIDLVVGGAGRKGAGGSPAIGAATGGAIACGKCGAPLNPASRFCRECGAPVTQPAQGSPAGQRKCPNCGAALSSGAIFCTECGAQVP